MASTTGTQTVQETKAYVNKTINYFGQVLINYSDLGIPKVIAGRLLWDEVIHVPGNYAFPSDSLVSVEVTNHLGFGEPIYIVLGTWLNRKNSLNVQLPEEMLSTLENLAVHLVITDTTHGTKSQQPLCRIIGVAWNVDVAIPEGHKQQLLPVRAAELGELPYRIDFPIHDAGMPMLEINSRFGDATSFVRSQHFLTLVLQAVVDELFDRIDPTEDYADNTWQSKYIRWAGNVFETPPEIEEEEDLEDWEVWVTNLKQAFCNHFAMSTRLMEILNEEAL